MAKDIILLGALAGIIGNIAKLLITLTMYFLGIINKTFIHLSGGYFGHESLDNIYSILNSIFSDFFYAALLGVIFYIALKYTGIDNAKLKGVTFGGFVHILNNGILIFGDFNQVTIEPKTNFLLIIPTIVFGILTCLVIERIEKQP